MISRRNCNCWYNHSQNMMNDMQNNSCIMDNECGCNNMSDNNCNCNSINDSCCCNNMVNNSCECNNAVEDPCQCNNFSNNCMCERKCGCNMNNCDMQEKMLNELQACDFTIEELALYLDTHPDDMRAVCMHNEHARHYRKLADEYQKMYGPLSIMYPCNSWRWLEEPWPWHRRMNMCNNRSCEDCKEIEENKINNEEGGNV